MTPTASTLSFEEFERLPDPSGGRYELVQGELTHVPPPKKGLKRIQMVLERWLFPRLPAAWICGSEFGARIAADSYVVPDVAVVNRARWESTPDEGYFHGAPELAVEILSRGNTATEIESKLTLYFEHGTQECWVVDPVRKHVVVQSIDQPRRSYSREKSIPLTRFGVSELLPVAALFAD